MPNPDNAWFEAVDLVGRRVRLSRLLPAYAPDILAAADDDAVFRRLSFRRPANLDQAQRVVDSYLSNPGLVAWAQFDHQSGELAGLTGYYDIDPALRTLAIGHTWLGRRHWRTGINTEAKLLLMTRAFDTLGAVRVVWHTDILNTRSQTAIERLGARKEGILRKHRMRPDGSWRDTVTYSMLDDEWPAAKARLRGQLVRR